MDESLFALPDGETVRDMRAAIEQWERTGKVIGVAIRRALLDQAAAVDLAKRARRATQISGANRVLLELLDGFHLLGDTPPPTGDPFDEFLAKINDAAT